MLTQADKERIAANIHAVTQRSAQVVSAMPSIIMRANLTDEEAVQYVDLYPDWEPDTEYEKDYIVKDGGQLYRLVSDYTSVEQYRPADDITHYTPITIDPETGYPVWQQPTGAHDAYALGYIVQDPTDGSAYRSLVDNNVWGPPHEQPQFWELYQASEE